MVTIATQPNLPTYRALRTIPDADFGKLTSESAAVKYACENSGLQDKAIAIEIGTDAGTLSKAKAGQARLNDDCLNALMNATGCEAPLFAWLLRRGYDPRSLRRIESDVERENRELRERLQQAEHDKRVLVEAFRGNVA